VRMGKLALWVVCGNCGREFDTGLRLDRRSFARGTLAANYHRCPFCGQRLTYRKADYRPRDDGWRQEAPGAGPKPSGEGT
jgi:DNA-directed RNA polymerase subunit RPC12/RpoP